MTTTTAARATATASLLPPCTGPTADPALFFPEGPEQLAAAQALCATCPLTRQCLAHAVALGVTDGVWGGVLLERGVVVHEKRRRGRPRKDAPRPAGRVHRRSSAPGA